MVKRGLSKQEDNRRVQILVTPELKKRLDDIFPWGEWNRTAVMMLEWLCDMHDTIGNHIFLLFRKGDFAEIVRRQVAEIEKEKVDG